MNFKLLRVKKIKPEAILKLETSAGVLLPADYKEFIQTHGCGELSQTWLRLPAKYTTPYIPDGRLNVQAFVPPVKSRIGQTESQPQRTFLAFAIRNDDYFLLELTPNSDNGIYYWARHPSESLDEAFTNATGKAVGTVSYAIRVADGFEQFVAAMEEG